MPRPARLAQDILDFVDHSSLDRSFEHEVVFVIHTAKQTSAHGLVSILSARGFECECGRESRTWSCTARRQCVLTLPKLEPMCQRLLVAIEDDTEPANGAAENLHSLALAFAAIQSRQTGREVAVGDATRLEL